MGHWNKPYVGAQVCRYCERGGLHWGMVGQKKKLLDKNGGVHVCRKNELIPKAQRLTGIYDNQYYATGTKVDMFETFTHNGEQSDIFRR